MAARCEIVVGGLAVVFPRPHVSCKQKAFMQSLKQLLDGHAPKRNLFQIADVAGWCEQFRWTLSLSHFVVPEQTTCLVQQNGCACRKTDGIFCFDAVILTTPKSETHLLCKVLTPLNYFEDSYTLEFRKFLQRQLCAPTTGKLWIFLRSRSLWEKFGRHNQITSGTY